MPPSFAISPAEAWDESQVRACAEAAYARYVVTIGRKPAPMVADFAALILSGQVHIARDEHGQLAGYIVFHLAKRDMYLDNVAVHPAFAGQGIGRTLIAFCEQQATLKGAGSVRLYTNEKMTENLAIYPHLGYIEIARRTEDGFRRVFFEKRL